MPPASTSNTSGDPGPVTRLERGGEQQIPGISSKERWALAVFLVVNLLMWLLPLVNSFRNPLRNKDYSTWVRVGHLVREGAPLFPPDIQDFHHNFFYPPAIASLFYAPLSYGGCFGMVLMLSLLTLASFFASLLLSVYFATGRVRHGPPLLYLLLFLICLPFVWDNYFLGQLNMTLLALMLLGFLALQQKRPVSAGALLALAAAAKAFPITALVYLLWRRLWTAALSMVACLFLILVVLPAPIRGFDRNLQELLTWADRTMLHNSGESLCNQPEFAYRYGNQTLLSVVHRLTRPLEVGSGADANLKVNFVNLSSTWSFFIFFVLAGFIGLIYLLAMPPRERQTNRTNALEYSILLILILVLSPRANSFYYCWVMPGFAMAITEAMRAPSGSPRRRWIIVGIASSLVVFGSAMTQVFDRTLQGYGATMWGAVLLYVTLVALLWDVGRSAPSHNPAIGVEGA